MSETKWQEVIPVFLVGVGIGAAVGILLAPKSGNETRDDISGALSDGADQIAAGGGKLNRRAKVAIKNLKDQVRDVAEAGEQAFREAKNAAAAGTQ